MTDEKKLILKMLKEGKISEDEAITLLDAIKTKKNTRDEKFYKLESSFIDKFVKAVDKIGAKSQEVIENLDFEDLSKNINFGSTFSQSAERLNAENIIAVENPDVLIKNSGDISIRTWEDDSIETRAKINFDEKLISQNFQFLKVTREENKITIEPNYSEKNLKHFNMNIVVMLPKKLYNSIEIESNPKSVQIDDLETKALKISSVNAKISINNLKADLCEIKTINGKIQVNSISGENLLISTKNGKINLEDLSSKNCDLKTINGPVFVAGVKSEAEKLMAFTSNGNISISLKNIYKPVKAKIENQYKDVASSVLSNRIFTNFVTENSMMVAYSDGFDEEKENLYIEASTENGAITIS